MNSMIYNFAFSLLLALILIKLSKTLNYTSLNCESRISRIQDFNVSSMFTEIYKSLYAIVILLKTRINFLTIRKDFPC